MIVVGADYGSSTTSDLNTSLLFALDEAADSLRAMLQDRYSNCFAFDGSTRAETPIIDHNHEPGQSLVIDAAFA